jgi:hypothetical protein
MMRHRIGLFAAFAVLSLCCGCLFDAGDGSGDGDLRIEGYVQDGLGRPIPDVTVKAYMSHARAAVSASTCSTKTNSNGFYRIGFDRDLIEIMVRPGKSECVFRPPQIAYWSPDSPLLNENFTGFCGVLHSISGYARDTEGDPLVGVAVTIRDDAGHWSNTVFTGPSGFYLLKDIVPGATYGVSPFLSGYVFDPSQRIYEDLDGDFEDQDFIASPEPIL